MNVSTKNLFAHNLMRGLRSRERQSGAVLIISLILLLIMTLLGVTTMNTTALQEKMAGNSQEVNRAFQAAETGLSQAFADTTALDLNDYDGDPVQIADKVGLTTEYDVSFEGWTNPPTGSLYSATSFQAAHFDMQSTGTTPGGVEKILHGGAFQIAPTIGN